jgi:probable HAF family extracellular repeat protein
MKTKKLVVLVTFSLAMSTAVLLQSQANAQARQATVKTPHVLLGLGTQHVTQGPASRSVPDPVALGLATARVYRFASADFPGAAVSLVFDENTTTILGDSSFSTGAFGFTLHGGLYNALSVPGSAANEATGINTGGAIVGIYIDSSNVTHGFLDNGGTFTTLGIATGTIEPVEINDSGEIVGIYIDSSNVNHGFSTVDNGTTYQFFDPPGSTFTQAAGVNSSGAIVGLWTDASNKSHGFLYSGGTFTQIDFPTATGTTAIGINDSNEIAGYYTDAASVNHGFILSNGAFTKVDVAGASGTQLTRIKNTGLVSGLYLDSNNETHGLTGH